MGNLRMRAFRYRASPSFKTQLGKLNDRLEKVEDELNGLRTTAQTAEANKQALQKQKSELAKLEDDISRIEVLTLPLGDEKTSPEADEVKVRAVQDLQDSLNAWRKMVETL